MELLDNRLSVQEKTSLHSSPCQCITEVLYFWTLSGTAQGHGIAGIVNGA